MNGYQAAMCMAAVCSFAVLVERSEVSSQQFQPGSPQARWAIKTSLPANADLTDPKTIALDDLLALGEPKVAGPEPTVKKEDPRFTEKRIPPFPNPLNLAEGDIISVTGWLWIVGAEPDGDYQIQISNSPVSGDHCLIVGVPNPDPAFVTSPIVREHAEQVRAFIRQRLLRGQEPSTSEYGNLMNHPPYVTVTGQLFYDDYYVGSPSRGKRNMQAATLWEIHPVTDIAFAPLP